MKKIIYILALLLLVVGVSAVSIHEECQDSGFDYGIAKYQCGSTTPSEGDGSTTTLSWNNCVSVDWTADPAVDGIISKEGTIRFVYPGGTSGTITKVDQHDISHITFCGNTNGEIPEFTAVTAGIALLGALGVFLLKKR